MNMESIRKVLLVLSIGTKTLHRLFPSCLYVLPIVVPSLEKPQYTGQVFWIVLMLPIRAINRLLTNFQNSRYYDYNKWRVLLRPTDQRVTNRSEMLILPYSHRTPIHGNCHFSLHLIFLYRQLSLLSAAGTAVQGNTKTFSHHR